MYFLNKNKNKNKMSMCGDMRRRSRNNEHDQHRWHYIGSPADIRTESWSKMFLLSRIGGVTESKYRLNKNKNQRWPSNIYSRFIERLCASMNADEKICDMLLLGFRQLRSCILFLATCHPGTMVLFLFLFVTLHPQSKDSTIIAPPSFLFLEIRLSSS